MAAIILVAALAISSNFIGRSYTSDDVAHQTLAHNLTQPSPHTFGVSNESFFLKLPVYLVFNALTHPGRLQLDLEVLLFNTAMVILLAIWWRISTKRSTASWFVFIWLIAAGAYWMAQTINPNTRNFELGLMLLFCIYAIRKISSPPSDRKSILLHVVGSSAIAGVLVYNDPYALLFVLIPLYLAMTIYFMLQKKPYQLLAINLILLASIAINSLLEEIFKHLGFEGVNGSVSSLGATLAPTIGQIEHVFNYCFLSLFGASPSAIHSNIRLLFEVILNLLVVCLALYGLCYSLYKDKLSLLNMWAILTFLFTIGYVLTAGNDVVYITRYLIILVPITALFVLRGLQRLARGPRKSYHLTLLLLGLSLCFNVSQSFVTIYTTRHIPQPNQIDYKIVAALEQNGVTKSYGDYWVANIAYYLSDYKANVLPLSCFSGKVYPDPVLVNTQRFKTPSKVTGVIVAPQLIIPTRDSYPVSKSCTVEATIKQFGEPQKIISVTPSTDILIYDHNPWGNSGI